MERSLAVANSFIERGILNSNSPTQMKLQKLMYFAHGWYLALYDKPLVNENFEAWKYGPVIRSVYLKFRHFGMKGIDELGKEYVVFEDESSMMIEPRVSFELNPFFDRIWTVYGKYSGNQLSAITHKNGSPWKELIDKYGTNRLDLIIPNDLIKNYFKGLNKK